MRGSRQVADESMEVKEGRKEGDCLLTLSVAGLVSGSLLPAEQQESTTVVVKSHESNHLGPFLPRRPTWWRFTPAQVTCIPKSFPQTSIMIHPSLYYYYYVTSIRNIINTSPMMIQSVLIVRCSRRLHSARDNDSSAAESAFIRRASGQTAHMRHSNTWPSIHRFRQSSMLNPERKLGACLRLFCWPRIDDNYCADVDTHVEAGKARLFPQIPLHFTSTYHGL